MGIRRKTRELVLQALFQGEFQQKPALDQFALLAENFQLSQKAVPLAKDLLARLSLRLEEVDAKIQEHAAHWRLDRMSVVDRNIIRIAIFEMLFCDDIPNVVSINEALEIAKKFSNEDSGPFINGILDAVQAAEKK